MAAPTRAAIATAFEIFDSSNTEMLAVEDVVLALHSLGKDLNQIQVNDAIMNASQVEEVTDSTRVTYDQFERIVQEKFQATSGPRPEAQRAFNLFDLQKKNIISADDMVEVARQLGEDPDLVRPKLEYFVNVASNGGEGVTCEQWMGIMDVKLHSSAEKEEEIEEY
eukprot:TRINITY_DN17164_c0_g1_i1.p1 TRINITY_DN17164_c0_g1~~TRINITY_DN17164_c0_g1_i1.p1  ORF type:complete len:166 (+),score=67.58 TRINITY_DN17164_c0_g1_i1:210-707(+)